MGARCCMTTVVTALQDTQSHARGVRTGQSPLKPENRPFPPRNREGHAQEMPRWADYSELYDKNELSEMSSYSVI
ncbi:hypothetical protein CC2G_007631 [Coprinopsis cinerea AmutBmut pab1-1]|nr:hypothetical protein CC2G_007631 [Coprinopsis cinerea AmutBmut pab1-1]